MAMFAEGQINQTKNQQKETSDELTLSTKNSQAEQQQTQLATVSEKIEMSQAGESTPQPLI